MNKKLMGTLSLVFAVLSVILVFIPSKSLDTAMIITAVGVLIAVVGAVLGFIGKKENKGMALAGIIISIISFIVLVLALVGFAGMKNATDCVEKSDGVYNCKLFDQDIEIPGEYLREDQKVK